MDCNREESIYHALSKWDTDSGKYVSAVEITVANMLVQLDYTDLSWFYLLSTLCPSLVQ